MYRLLTLIQSQITHRLRKMLREHYKCPPFQSTSGCLLTTIWWNGPTSWNSYTAASGGNIKLWHFWMSNKYQLQSQNPATPPPPIKTWSPVTYMVGMSTVAVVMALSPVIQQVSQWILEMGKSGRWFGPVDVGPDTRGRGGNIKLWHFWMLNKYQLQSQNPATPPPPIKTWSPVTYMVGMSTVAVVMALSPVIQQVSQWILEMGKSGRWFGPVDVGPDTRGRASIQPAPLNPTQRWSHRTGIACEGKHQCCPNHLRHFRGGSLRGGAMGGGLMEMAPKCDGLGLKGTSHIPGAAPICHNEEPKNYGDRWHLWGVGEQWHWWGKG